MADQVTEFAEEIENIQPSEDASSKTINGKVFIEDDVLAQLATNALCSVEGVVPAKQGRVTNFLGRKIVNGIRIDKKDEETCELEVEAFISIKYGQRIPDVCWDVQSAIKEQVENYTGYTVKAVNITVQGITFSDNKNNDADEIDSGDSNSSENA